MHANYGRTVLLNPNATYWGGMSTPDANPRGGVFGPQGYGGGIFDGMSGLGEARPVEAEARESYDAVAYPWGQYSASTLSVQIATNVELDMRGLPRIAEDGVLGPETCGANRMLYEEDGLLEHEPPTTCRSYQYPRQAPAPSAPPVTVSTEDEPPTYRRRAGMGTGAFLLVAGVVAAAGIYYATRKA